MIVTGGSICDVFALSEYQKIQPEILIGVDRGLAFLYRQQIMPTHIVGDFDSIEPAVIKYYRNQTEIPIREFNPVKDASDTEIAVRLAVELGVSELWILGATGTRLDHVMANIQVLKIALDAKIKAYILDPNNKIYLTEKEAVISREKAYGQYFSVFPLGGEIKDLSITGAKYPLENYTVYPYDSLCVSNQIAGEEARIQFQGGIAILMETRDKMKEIEEI